MASETGLALDLADYREHIIGTGANADVAAYVALKIGDRTSYGVGIDRSMATASMKAVVSSVNRALRRG
jgi:2-isopropylmalate synthase